MKFKKIEKYDYLGIYFLFLFILVTVRNYIFNDNYLIFFYCDNVLLLFSIAFFTKNIQLIKGLISLGLIGQGIYSIDLIQNVFFDNYFLGWTQKIDETSFIQVSTSLLIHIGSTFIALLFTFKEKIKIKSIHYSLIYLIIIYFLTILITPEELDINCVFNGCGINLLLFESLTFYWIPTMFIIFAIPGFLIQKLIYIIYSKINKMKNEKN